MTSHTLVTGALGCIGSWIVRDLVRQGARVTTYDLDDNPHRMKLIMTPDELSQSPSRAATSPTSMRCWRWRTIAASQASSTLPRYRFPPARRTHHSGRGSTSSAP